MVGVVSGVQRFGELEDVFGGDVFVADLEREIRALLPDIGVRSQPDQLDFGLKLFFRPATPCPVSDDGVDAVFVVHVKNECGSAVVIDQTARIMRARKKLPSR